MDTVNPRVNPDHVRNLIRAGWTGMSAVMEDDKTYTAEEVVNASVNLARQGIKYAMDPQFYTSEQVHANRQAIRETLKKLLLDTADDAQVM